VHKFLLDEANLCNPMHVEPVGNYASHPVRAAGLPQEGRSAVETGREAPRLLQEGHPNLLRRTGQVLVTVVD
jgi:hypothetical protein